MARKVRREPPSLERYCAGFPSERIEHKGDAIYRFGMNRRGSWLSVLVLLFGAACDRSKPSDVWLGKAQKLTAEYQNALKGELMAAMKAGGPVKAIQVCNLKAADIGGRISKKEGMEQWSVRRTALRVRSPKNQPSDKQQAVLSEMARRILAGESPKNVDWYEREGENFVYMSPIMMGDVCVTCHGSRDSIPGPIKAELARLYPKDEATGFSVGALRGAFVVTGPPEKN